MTKETDVKPDNYAWLQALLDNATQGPWYFQPWSKYAGPSGEYMESILLANGAPDGEIIRDLQDKDGMAIAQLMNAAPGLIAEVNRTRRERDAIIEAVRTLHPPVTGHPDLDRPWYEATWCGGPCGEGVWPCEIIRTINSITQPKGENDND